MSELLLMECVSKSFGGIQALQQVNFHLQAKQVHALVGKNGAGKSTLMKILMGVHPPDAGQIYLHGNPVSITSPQAAHNLGISIVYQELSLIPTLTVAENVFLGRLPHRQATPLVDWNVLARKTQSVMERVDRSIDPRESVSNLSIAQQQIVEIAKALSTDPQILILDEPTSALTDQEVNHLFEIIRTLKKQDVGIIYISHRLAEVEQIADYITVLRDGQTVGEGPMEQLNHQQVVHLMVGSQLASLSHEPQTKTDSNEVVLSVRGLSRGNVLNHVSFDLYRGEILGIAGLMGAGRTELLRAIFGVDPIDQGEITINGKLIPKPNPRMLKRLGMALTPEDRKTQGLIMGMSVRRNMTLTILQRISRFGFIRSLVENQIVRRLIEQLDIVVDDPAVPVESLSGGNQQKVVLAKWLANKPTILMLDEPTRGVDVGAKSQIFSLLQDLTAQGVSVIFISSELEEVVDIADRILTMHKGQIVAEVSGSHADMEHILLSATGGLSVDVTTNC